MSRFLLVITAIFLLTACNQGGTAKKPSIPQNKTLQASVLESTRYQEKEKKVDMDRLVEKIDEEIKQPDITTEDIERGWYYAQEEEKKTGTPGSWLWLNEGIKSRWISQQAVEDIREAKVVELCHKTGGDYVISCLEREAENCQYVRQSECRCDSDTKWTTEQGCVLIDEDGNFVRVSPDDLKRGWYLGLPNQKKLSTPLSWVCTENGKESRWQNPSPVQ